MNASPVRLWKILTLALAAWLLAATPSHADTYAQWVARVFTAAEQANPAISGENACPAGDGVSNLMKFAFDLDPHKSGAAGLPFAGTVLDYNYQTGQQEPFLALTYSYPYYSYYPENLTYVPEVTANLQDPNGWLRGPNVIGYFNAQYPQNPGDPYLLTYKALSPISMNPTGLFMHLRVIEGHTLPANWLQQYFPGQTILPDDDADGDGISNWNEYLNGTDPTDFYNGTLPTLTLVGGGNQRGSPGTVLPTPITVIVDSYGTFNAPLTFTVTSGNAQVASGNGSGYTPSATVDIRSISPYPDAYGNMSYVAQAYVYLPNTGNNHSTITVTAKSGTQTTSISTVAIASDPNVQPPSGFGAVATAATRAGLSWTPSDPSLGTNVEVSYDAGVTWSGLASFPPGASTGTLTHLAPNQKISVRMYTASATGSGSGTNGAGGTNTTASPNDDGSNPTGSADVEPLSVPVVEGEQAEFYGRNYSFAGFQSSPNVRYLHEHEHINNPDSDNDDDAGDAVYESEVTPKTGDVAVTLTGSSDIDFTLDGGYTILSDTSKHGIGYDDDISNGDNGTDDATLSEVYPLPTFKSDAEGWVPAFQGQRTDWVDKAHLYFLEQGGSGYGGGHPDSISYDHVYDIAKLQYKFRCNSDPNGTVAYDIVFTPDDGSDPVHDVHLIQTHGATEVGAEDGGPITLDPTALNNKKNGSYQIIPVELQPDDFPDSGDGSTNNLAGNPNGVEPDQGQTDVTGAIVAGSTGSTAKHFVSPKKVGGFVVLRAEVHDDADFASNFAWVQAPGYQPNGSKISIPRDTPGKYPVQIKTLKTGAIVTVMNVWVVSATMTAYDASTQTSAIDGRSLGVISGRGILHAPDGSVLGRGYLPRVDIDWRTTIQPASIITDTDRPLIEKQTRVSPPGDDNSVPSSTHADASGSGFSGWDISRQRQTQVNIGPSLTPTDASAGPYQPVAFPASDTEGNDDHEVSDEDSDPYTAGRGVIGQIISTDNPNFGHVDAGDALQQGGAGVDGDQMQFKTKFREFVRVQIGGKWYRCSESTDGLWRMFFNIKRSNGQWNLLPGTTLVFDLTNND